MDDGGGQRDGYGWHGGCGGLAAADDPTTVDGADQHAKDRQQRLRSHAWTGERGRQRRLVENRMAVARDLIGGTSCACEKIT